MPVFAQEYLYDSLAGAVRYVPACAKSSDPATTAGAAGLRASARAETVPVPVPLACGFSVFFPLREVVAASTLWHRLARADGLERENAQARALQLWSAMRCMIFTLIVLSSACFGAEPSAPSDECPAPLGAAVDIAATPRSDSNLELLALSIDHGRVTADEETYSRVVADIAAVREANPQIARVSYFPRTGGRELLVYPNEQTMELIRDGKYSAWNCLNDFYGLQRMELGADDKYFVLSLKGIYNLDLVSQLYKELPGIMDVEPNLGAGDGPTICAKRNGSEYEYVVDRADGDCPSGCTIHEAHAFLSSAAGVIEARGVWNSETNEPPPEWFSRICRSSRIESSARTGRSAARSWSSARRSASSASVKVPCSSPAPETQPA